MAVQSTANAHTVPGRVLIVDQDPIITGLLARYMAHFLTDAEILEANTARTALSLVDSAYAWAFIVDADLPDAEGSSLVYELLQRFPGSVAIRSGSRDLPHLNHPNLLMSLSKPYDIHLLTGVICEALRCLQEPET